MTAKSILMAFWRRRRVTSLCSALLFFGMPTFGFCFEPHASVACEFLDSDAVFTGKVISVQTINNGEFIGGWHYRLNVSRAFRGPRDKVMDVYTANDSGRYTLELSREYLIFASEDKHRLWIGNCDDSAPLPQAGELIREVQGIAIPHDGIIEGRVILNYVPSGKGVSGIQVRINGEGKTYSVITDQQGWFRLHVPPGTYSVEAESTPAHPIIAYDLNYGGDPKNFVVKAGRCAGFEFVANSMNKY